MSTDLTDAQLDVAERLGRLTGETVAAVVDRLGATSIPRSAHLSPRIPAILSTTFTDAGVEAGMPYVTLPNGRRFYGLPSQATHTRQHELLHGLLDPKIPPEAFLVAMDVVHRYVADRSVPLDLLPGPGGTIVEVGAFLGHKAVRMLDASIGSTGRYVGIELLPDNCAVMSRNFEVNALDNTTVVAEGVWEESGTMAVMGKGRQRNTLVDMDGGRLASPLGYRAPVNPLHDILDRTLGAGSVVDFMYVSVNGAEVQAVRSLGPWAQQVQAIRVAAPYEVDGQPTADIVRAELQGAGFTLRGAHRSVVVGTREC